MQLKALAYPNNEALEIAMRECLQVVFKSMNPSMGDSLKTFNLTCVL